MTWEHPSAVHSPAADGHGADTSEFQLTLATLIQARGSALLDALESHLPGARGHADGTASYAFATAVELGFARSRAEEVRETARIHAVGEVYVPAAVLAGGNGQLTDHDRTQLEARFVNGAELARGAGIPEQACGWMLNMNERFDGAGPKALRGGQIPIESRIVRVACACDAAMASPSLASESDAAERYQFAIGELDLASGRELDPRVVEALAAMLERVATPSHA